MMSEEYIRIKKAQDRIVAKYLVAMSMLTIGFLLITHHFSTDGMIEPTVAFAFMALASVGQIAIACVALWAVRKLRPPKPE
jgi:hypothetical protein